MENKHKALIGIGVIAAIAVGYYFYNKKSEVKKAEPETKNPEEKAADTSVSASQPKKELSQSEADGIAQKIFKTKEKEAVSKMGKGYVSPTIELLKQLKDSGYQYVEKINPTKTGSFKYGAAVKLDLGTMLGLDMVHPK